MVHRFEDLGQYLGLRQREIAPYPCSLPLLPAGEKNTQLVRVLAGAVLEVGQVHPNRCKLCEVAGINHPNKYVVRYGSEMLRKMHVWVSTVYSGAASDKNRLIAYIPKGKWTGSFTSTKCISAVSYPKPKPC